ncbi:MAG TPA: TldD/PmbA family protein [Thermodesulfobacteriota bacterium]|nr:TldD/PmbA family protein [Thermodesulfobacteriota bacterium]
MITVESLRECVREGLEFVKSQKDIREAEIYALWSDRLTVRINYTSDIPCNGVQEPKNIAGYGVGIVAVFDTPEGTKVGSGSDTGDLSLEGIRRALEKAKQSAVNDPDFISLPSPSDEQPKLSSYHDTKVMSLEDEEMVSLGWRALKGTLFTFKKSGFTKSLIVGGDITIAKERMAIGNTNGIDDFDESSALFASITAMIEEKDAKGTGWTTATHLEKFRPEEAGEMAARSAINTIGGNRIKSGKYNVVFGRHAIATLFSEMIISALSLNSIDMGNSPYVGKLGQKVASDIVSIYDDGAREGEIMSRKITCEGLPAGRTDLIHKGTLSGFLSNHYYAKKYENNIRKFIPRNGFRFGHEGRDYRHTNSIHATNLVIEGTREVDSEKLISRVKNGIYIGRLWYLYPFYGLAKAYFTGTIVGDSYIIRDGKLAEPIKPNTVRINDNFVNVLQNITAISKEKKSTVIWGSHEVIVAPEIAVKGVNLENVAEFVEEL